MLGIGLYGIYKKVCMIGVVLPHFSYSFLYFTKAPLDGPRALPRILLS